MTDQKKTLVFGILLQQHQNALRVVSGMVGDGIVLPQILLDVDLKLGEDDIFPGKLRKVFENLGFKIPRGPGDAIRIFRMDPQPVEKDLQDEVIPKVPVVGYLIKRVKSDQEIVNGVMQTEDGREISYSLERVDDDLLKHLPENQRQGLINAIEEMVRTEENFKRPIFEKMRIVHEDSEHRHFHHR